MMDVRYVPVKKLLHLPVEEGCACDWADAKLGKAAILMQVSFICTSHGWIANEEDSAGRTPGHNHSFILVTDSNLVFHPPLQRITSLFRTTVESRIFHAQQNIGDDKIGKISFILELKNVHSIKEN